MDEDATLPETFDRRQFLARSARTAAGVAALGAGASGLLSACGLGAQSTSASSAGVSGATPNRGGRLGFATEADAEGLDPTQGIWGATGLLYARTVYDTLAAVDATGTARPYLAESISPDNDRTRWTITVRGDVTFHDGSPLGASAVKVNLDALRSAPLAGQALENIASVDVIDPMTVVVSMKSPWAPFPYHLTGQLGVVVEPRTLLAGDAARKPVGTGPFVLDRWTAGESFTATRNPHYWRQGLPYLDQIEYRPIADPQPREDAFTSGRVDMMHSSDSQNVSNLRGDPSFVTVDDAHSSFEPDMDFVMLNTAAPPTDDPTVRLALAHAIDKQKIIDNVRNGIPPKSFGPFARGSMYHGSTGYPFFELDRSRALVRRHGPISLRLSTVDTSKGRKTARLIRDMWGKAGIHCQVVPVERSQLLRDVLAGDFQACVWRQFTAPDPDVNYPYWSIGTAPLGQAHVNLARSGSPQRQQALDAARASTDPDGRAAAYQTVARILATELPYLWTNRAIWMVAAKHRVMNFAGSTLPTGAKARGMSGGVITPSEVWLGR